MDQKAFSERFYSAVQITLILMADQILQLIEIKALAV
jgi:hypothetical protein